MKSAGKEVTEKEGLAKKYENLNEDLRLSMHVKLLFKFRNYFFQALYFNKEEKNLVAVEYPGSFEETEQSEEIENKEFK